jgi:dTDP-4-amino-4,6-dideoxygalactose transaminase
MLNTPFSPWPSYTQEEADAVARVVLSNRVNYWTGQECREFEKEFAAFSGVSHAVSLTNGTVALELALKVLDIGPGDEVIVTSRTFLASVSAIVTVGATPVFADVDADSQNITADTVAQVLSPRTKAVICVHLAGWPCDMDAIRQVTEARKIALIEDCAQAHGARYRGRPVGALGTVAAWSFCQDKIMTTGGEGGMLTTESPELWDRSWSYKDHGKSYKSVYQRQHPPGFRWLHDSFGTNWRMLEVQAVLGRIQLGRMATWHAQRRDNARRILEACKHSPVLRVPEPTGDIEHAWYRAYAFVRPETLAPGWSRDRVMNEIIERRVPCYSGSCSEVYLEKAFDGTSYRPAKRLPVAQMLGETSLAFLVHPTLSSEEIDRTVSAIDEVSRRAAG